MSSLPSRLVARLSNRPDSEHQQALVRLVMLAVVVAYLQGVVNGRPEAAEPLRLSLHFLAVEFAVAFAILAWILARPGVSPPRRVLGMVADYSLMGVGMALLGELLAPMYVILLWVTVGNGLRYGPRFLYAAIVFAATTFLVVILRTPYWQANPWLGWGLLLGLVAVPLYLSSLLHALVRATEAAKAASEAKSRFLANMSHEFRTPLNGIVGMAELLATTPMSAEQRDSADVIQTSARALQLLVDDVLDFATIEAGKLKRSDTDFSLAELTKGVHVMLQPSAHGKGLALETSIAREIPDALHGDSGHLRQILINLMSNAIKFTERGKVALDVQLQQADATGVRLRFSVRDTGIGIPEEDLGRIFEAFEQVDSGRGRRFGGTGLGTTIAKVLTELLGGRIDVESRLGAGSHFWFELPLQLAAASAVPAGDSNVISFDDPFVRHRARVRSLRVLVADDQSANLLVMRRLLEKAGHRPQVVDDGNDVLNALEAQQFDVVITDLHMPGVSGIEIMKQTRFMEAGRQRTPFIVLTADATPEARLESERAGAYAFLTKPLAIDRLLEKLAAVGEGVETAAEVESRPPAGAGNIGVGTGGAGSGNPLSQHILDELREMKLGEDFVHRFLSECARDARKALAELEIAGNASQWDDFRDGCHALKGAAGNMGAVRLAGIASEGMGLGSDRLQRDWRGLLQQLRQQLQQALTALRERGDLTRQEAESDTP
jgi:two-component system sensor histidine kinase RpfC